LTISFRTRLFVVSALIVAGVLSAVVALGWASLRDAQFETLDERLCNEARRVATQPLVGEELARLESDLAIKLRLGSTAELLVRYEPRDGGPAFESAGWAEAPALASLPWVARHAPLLREPPPRPPPLAPPGARRPMPPPANGPPACALASFEHRGGHWRAARFDTPFGQSAVAADLASAESALQGAVGRTLATVVPLALVLTALGAWLLASLTMRPVNRLRVAMGGVSQRALDQRLSGAGEDREFKELIGAYNTMLGRLEASFGQASRFSADAAHELKTPLTILQGRIEQALARSDQGALQDELTQMLEEVGRLALITRKLLLLSQADAGRLDLQRARVDVSQVLEDLVTDARMMVADGQLQAHVAPELAAQADAVLLRQLLNNLMANAVRHRRPGGYIHVRAQAHAGAIEIDFANQTVPIEAAERARFFERFYRGDASHGRRVDGSGLGLSLALEIARAHGGDLRLEASASDEVRLRLCLPAATAAAGK
jgi:two-component system, OmpR family, heavy metal sensor histidine kinase CusS